MKGAHRIRVRKLIFQVEVVFRTKDAKKTRKNGRNGLCSCPWGFRIFSSDQSGANFLMVPHHRRAGP